MVTEYTHVTLVRVQGHKKQPILPNLLLNCNILTFLRCFIWSSPRKDTSSYTFAAKDLHIEYLNFFCSWSSPKSQCGIDMICNCGPFYLITLTFPSIHHTDSYNSAMTVTVQDDHLTARAWVACDSIRDFQTETWSDDNTRSNWETCSAASFWRAGQSHLSDGRVSSVRRL